jgi:uncharacterized membrane protein
MIIMALDHTRDYFHNEAFLYSPTDLQHTTVFLFFTRWITHFCAPIFVFLAGISAYLYGARRTRNELSFFLFTRGLWLVFIELFIISLERTFNPSYPYFNLQVIYAIGLSMIALSAIIRLNRGLILALSIALIAGHNLLDKVHETGQGIQSFLWSLLYEVRVFTFGRTTVFVHYPVLPWIGIISIGYYLGSLYASGYDPQKRRKTLITLGLSAIAVCIVLRSGNFYGDPAHWSVQENPVFSMLSFLNVTKYPPSLLYTLMTLGPALFFLALTERPLNKLTEKITVFGRVPMFFYLAHILLIHILALFGAVVQGYQWSSMVLSTQVDNSATLKGYGFNLTIVYAVWVSVILILYPFCKWFDKYKRSNSSRHWWLSYL